MTKPTKDFLIGLGFAAGIPLACWLLGNILGFLTKCFWNGFCLYWK